ncbi:hypothetical protein D2E64_21875, partial [Mycobacteroides abscessus]
MLHHCFRHRDWTPARTHGREAVRGGGAGLRSELHREANRSAGLFTGATAGGSVWSSIDAQGH